jgi:organic hydroperoxide reductase OsmC/OhrA
VRHVELDQVTCEVEFDWALEGSIKKGTINAACSQVRFRVNVASTSSDDDVRAIVALAEKGCFVEQLIQMPVPVQCEVTVNAPTDDANE